MVHYYWAGKSFGKDSIFHMPYKNSNVDLNTMAIIRYRK